MLPSLDTMPRQTAVTHVTDSQVEVIPGAPKVNQISIDPEENQSVQMAKIMKKINDADAAKKLREYEHEQVAGLCGDA